MLFFSRRSIHFLGFRATTCSPHEFDTATLSCRYWHGRARASGLHGTASLYKLGRYALRFASAVHAFVCSSAASPLPSSLAQLATSALREESRCNIHADQLTLFPTTIVQSRTVPPPRRAKGLEDCREFMVSAFAVLSLPSIYHLERSKYPVSSAPGGGLVSVAVSSGLNYVAKEGRRR
jgi:hypothetical protein